MQAFRPNLCLFFHLSIGNIDVFTFTGECFHKRLIFQVTHCQVVRFSRESYAVKSSYLINVINALENLPSLPTKNLLSGKNLADQIKLVRDFIFMIEVY